MTTTAKVVGATLAATLLVGAGASGYAGPTPRSINLPVATAALTLSPRDHS